MSKIVALPGVRRWVGALVGIFAVVSLSACDYARMRDQESVRTYEQEMPEMDPRSVPQDGGYQVLKSFDSATFRNPMALTEQSVNEGRQAYAYFCTPCHGQTGDGRGTVGQSFAPLPTDLRSREVRSQTDGALYLKIRLGFRRHPNLYRTMTEGDTWAVINYLRVLQKGP